MRRCVLIALVLFTVVAPAEAAPRALYRGSGVWAFAPAGEHVLVVRGDGSHLRVLAIPLAGGAAREVFRFDPPSGRRVTSVGFAASAQRAVLRVEMGKGSRELDAVQTFAGPVTGGWSELHPLTEFGSPGAVYPFRLQVDGERIFTTESAGDDVRVMVRDPDPHEVPVAAGEIANTSIFAGDLVAFATDGGDEDSNALVVRDWRTGSVVTSAQLPDSFESIALRPDGRAAVTAYVDGSLYDVRPGGRPRRLARYGGSGAAWAGDSLVYDPDEVRLRVIDASGHNRRFGAPTRTLDGFATDGSRVVWMANGCLLVDDVSAPPAAAAGPGPCVRSELALDSEQASPYLTHSLSVPLRCVAAPRACRGTLRLTPSFRWAHRAPVSRPLRFSIPAGHVRRLNVPLTCRGYRVMRRNLARAADAVVSLDARTLGGERYPGDPWFELSSGPAQVAARCGEAPVPSRLPGSVDVAPLRGSSVPGVPCTFARDVGYGNPGDGTIRLSVTCRTVDDVESFGAVDVERVQSGHPIPEDSLRCEAEADRDPDVPPLQTCAFWHGKISLDTTALCLRRCNAKAEARARRTARATLESVVRRLGALPAAPCRLCPKYFPPERVEQLTHTFSGKGPKRLGTIRVRVDSRLQYIHLGTGDMRVTSGPRVLLKAKGNQGESSIRPGTYRHVKVIASGEWTLTIAPR